MDSAKSQRLRLRARANQIVLSVAPRSPAAQSQVLVKEKISRAFAVLNGQRCERLILSMESLHSVEVNGADDIHVVHKKRRLRVTGSLEKEMGNPSQSASGVE